MDTERCIATEVLDRLSAAEAWEYRVIPCAFRGKVLVCYGEEGRDYTQVMEELEVLTGNTLVVEPMAPEEFRRLIHRCYRKTGREATKQFVAGHSGFLYDLIDDAYRNYASDIHFEPYEHICRVRFRIDGQLIERHVIEKGNYASVVNQIKILANLDISEKRLPQDGRIFYHHDEARFDVRVSVLPVIHGEKVVLRLLTRHAELLELDNLGFDARQLRDYLGAVRKPHGLVLICGPTGSGKSTTLYATLRLLNETTRNILTIEDPVEYTLEGVNQVQLREDIGLTFSAALRTFLRQDPDIVMLGEIRDADTAQMAIRSALTGHLIFSTIHTNSAWGCVSRLTDMGVHPYLLADTLVLCVAQRLVRLLCPHCKVPPDDRHGFRAVGCEACYDTGYAGRKAIYEVLPVDDRLASAIRRTEEVAVDPERLGIRTLRASALELVEQGLTSYEEVLPLLNECL